MATRDLSKQFINIRTRAKSDPTARRRTPEDYEQEVDIESIRSRLSPGWGAKIEKAEKDMAAIKKGMAELTGLHTKRLMGNSDFDTDEAKQEREIDLKTMEITEHFRHAEGLLKQFAKQGDEQKLSDAEYKVRKNLQSGMAKRLQTLSGKFRATQKEYMNRVQKQKAGTDGGAAYDLLSKDPRLVESLDQGFNQQQIGLVSDMEELVNQRDEEINKIAKSVEELATIFKELSVLIIDQGTILDRIDYNMDQAVEHTKEGTEQLVKAETNQKNALPFRCIVVLVLLIACMVGVIIWQHMPKSSSNSSSSDSGSSSNSNSGGSSSGSSGSSSSGKY